MFYAATVALTGLYVVAVLVRPRWTLEVPFNVGDAWAREMGVLYVAPLTGLVFIAIAVPPEARDIVLAGAFLTVALSSLVDLWRVSAWGLVFDALMALSILAARVEVN